jgi:hypothetical protein
MLRSSDFAADRRPVREHCAQCLTEVFTSGYGTPTGETLCGPCYFALWGPRTNGNRLANVGRPRSRRPRRGKPVWTSGPTRFLEPVPADQRGRWRR